MLGLRNVDEIRNARLLCRFFFVRRPDSLLTSKREGIDKFFRIGGAIESHFIVPQNFDLSHLIVTCFVLYKLIDAARCASQLSTNGGLSSMAVIPRIT